MFELRDYQASDSVNLYELFYSTVHEVNAGDYTEEELGAWAPERADMEEWERSFLGHRTVVAVEDGRVQGFGDIDPTGYLDRLYVRGDCQRRGIATAICDILEGTVSVDRITTHASITAKPFFEKRGYQTVKRQQVIRKGVSLTNYVMIKKISR